MLESKTGPPRGWPISFARFLQKIANAPHTPQAFAPTIFCPALQPKAWANSAIFQTTCSMSVELATLIVESVSEFVTDNHADCAVVDGIVHVFLKERRVQNTGGKIDRI